MLPSSHQSIPTPISEPAALLFCDSLALYYIAQRAPHPLLARLFGSAEPRLAGALLGVIDLERRQKIYQLMNQQKEQKERGRGKERQRDRQREEEMEEEMEEERDKARDREALDALIIIANDLLQQGLIYRRGIYLLGKRRDAPLG